MADTIAVMYLGRVVESGSARAIFKILFTLTQRAC